MNTTTMPSRGEIERLPIGDEVELIQAVLQVGRLARRIGFDDVASAKVMTAVSELARNILKYAGTGAICAAPLNESTRSGIEVIAEDNGPGIANVQQALEDHFSSSGTLGLGLPGVRRMMDEFEIVSAGNQGTTITVRKWL